ncbi:MAG: GNAT family N-acetyltransferase [Chitinivibrionales bacterium]|nr:GNAT family N-acetyltransferase [Chitinivibrionales bacterium]
MHDMLVKLYELDGFLKRAGAIAPDITIRKPIGPEKHVVMEWVAKKFNNAWKSETDVALSNDPATCLIAIVGNELIKELVGFACYDATARGFFGPMGVAGPHRKKGIGRALTLAALADMRSHGYGYAIIGGVGPAEFYRTIAGAVDIEGSTPSIWKTWLQ